MSKGASETRPASAVFGERTRSIVVAIALISLVATIGSMVFGRRLAPPPAQPRDSYGHGPLGHRAFLETLRALGIHAERWTLPTHEPVSAPLWVIEPNSDVMVIEGHDHSLEELVRTRYEAERITILVLPKWELGLLGTVSEVPGYDVYPVVRAASCIRELRIDRPPLTDTRDTIQARDEDGLEWELSLRWPQRLIGGIPVLSDEHGAFVVRDPKSLVFVVSDPDLLHSSNVQRADHMAFWHAFVRDRLDADTVVIDEVFHGAVETRSLAELFAEWPGVLALFHAGLIVAVILAMGRRRFGPPQPVPEALGRGPREVIEVAASVLANGSRVGTLASRYVEGLVGELHRRLGLREGKSIEQRAEQVDAAAAGRRLEPKARELLARAHALEGTRRAGEAIAIAREAAHFRGKMIGARSRSASVAAHESEDGTR